MVSRWVAQPHPHSPSRFAHMLNTYFTPASQISHVSSPYVIWMIFTQRPRTERQISLNNNVYMQSLTSSTRSTPRPSRSSSPATAPRTFLETSVSYPTAPTSISQLQDPTSDSAHSFFTRNLNKNKLSLNAPPANSPVSNTPSPTDDLRKCVVPSRVPSFDFPATHLPPLPHSSPASNSLPNSTYSTSNPQPLQKPFENFPFVTPTHFGPTSLLSSHSGPRPFLSPRLSEPFRTNSNPLPIRSL